MFKILRKDTTFCAYMQTIKRKNVIRVHENAWFSADRR